VVIEARGAAEAGARAALEALAVHHYEPYPHMKPAQRQRKITYIVLLLLVYGIGVTH
jgi:hypothetical protein